MISAASPLILYAKAGLLDLLLDGPLEVLAQVMDECLRRGPEADALREVAKQGRLRTVTVPAADMKRLAAAHPYLGMGEIAALAKAHAEILVDDRQARLVARARGLRPVGCLGVLARAHGQGRITHRELVEALGRLLRAGLWVAPDVMAAFLADVDRAEG